MSKKNGGPAFPVCEKTKNHVDNYEMLVMNPGMSLRDYFAAMALQGLISNGHGNFREMLRDKDLCANFSYSMADEMIKQREE